MVGCRLNSAVVAADLFEQHQPLAHHIARRFVKLARIVGLEPADIVQAALMGLWHACQRFDSGRGFKFSTYGHRCIDGYCKRLLNSYRHATEDGRFEEPLAMGGNSMAEQDLFEEILEDRRQADPVHVAHVEVCASEARESLDRMGRDGMALTMHADGATFREIAAIVGVSHERVRQLRDRAAAKVRRMFAARRHGMLCMAPALPPKRAKGKPPEPLVLHVEAAPKPEKPKARPPRTAHRRVKGRPARLRRHTEVRACSCGRRWTVSRARTVRTCPRCRQEVA